MHFITSTRFFDAQVIVQREYAERIFVLLLEPQQTFVIGGILSFRESNPFFSKNTYDFTSKLADLFEFVSGYILQLWVPGTYKRIEGMAFFLAEFVQNIHKSFYVERNLVTEYSF